MKNKWLIILFIFFLGVILLSLLITRQSQKAVSLSETEQVESRILPAYSPQQVSPAPIARLPLGRSGITIIKAPSKAPPSESAEKSLRVPEIADKALNNVSSLNVASSSEAQDSPQAGITKTGKQPTPQEIQEMNSNGIVMY